MDSGTIILATITPTVRKLGQRKTASNQPIPTGKTKIKGANLGDRYCGSIALTKSKVAIIAPFIINGFISFILKSENLLGMK
jgi:hypothetical protein